MKRIISKILVFIMVASVVPAIPYEAFAETVEEGIEINETNFPDKGFREYVKRFDYRYGKDGVLDANEIEEVNGMKIDTYVHNLKGLELFTYLEELTVVANYLEEIPVFPDSLLEIDLTNNYLTKLPTLPSNLKRLECDINRLTELPSLPDTLTYLACDQNKLTTLPDNLPNNLTYLDCYDNELTELPPLPDSLEELSCGTNKLTELPDNLPNNLYSLSCSNSELTELPSLPDSLSYLYCYSNKLTKLPDELPSELKSLWCFNNQLEELPVLPESLHEIDCSSNYIKSISKIPEGLSVLNCSKNDFTSAPEFLSTEGLELTQLDLSYGKISGILDISNLHYLRRVNLYDNLLTGLIVSDKARYEYVDVDKNYMSGEEDIQGRSEIDWDVFYFGEQKTYCEAYGHNYLESIDKATFYDPGRIDYICSNCGERDPDKDSSYIPGIYEVELSGDTYTYDGNVKNPNIVVTDEDGYIISSDNYTVTIPSGRKDVGKYTYSVTFKNNYEGTKDLTMTINPAKLNSVSLSATEYTYNGKVKNPTVTVKAGSSVLVNKKTIGNNNVDITYPTGRINAGTYRVTVKGKGNYTGTITKTFKINPSKVTTVSLSATSYTFNNKVKTPTVTVKAGNLVAASKRTTDSSSVDLTYASGRKSVGTYKVTVKGKGNYTGTITKTFKINPAGKSISKLSGAKKAFTVKWSKPSSTYRKQMTGYQIQYSTSSKMTKPTKATIKSTTAISKKISSKIKAKKYYYVQLRTYKKVGKTTYYSSWSKVKKVKTK